MGCCKETLRGMIDLKYFPAPSHISPHTILSPRANFLQFSSVHFSCSVVSNSLPPSWTAAHEPSLSITNSQSLLKLMSIESVMPSNHLILCCPLLLPPSIFPSIRVFSNKSVLHIRWPKYWSFSFSISPFNEYSGSISFKIDWFDLFALQQTIGIYAAAAAAKSL